MGDSPSPSVTCRLTQAWWRVTAQQIRADAFLSAQRGDARRVDRARDGFEFAQQQKDLTCPEGPTLFFILRHGLKPPGSHY
ncbi:MAG: hypothetical protein AAFQ82_08840 [Myxococcota bacterium]